MKNPVCVSGLPVVRARKATATLFTARNSALAIASALALTGCAGAINRIEVIPSSRVCDAAGICGLPEGGKVKVKVWGTGKCDNISVKFGDGTGQQFSGPVDFGTQSAPTPWEVPQDHVYRNVWPGAKVIHAFSVAQCAGEQRQSIIILNGQPGNFRSTFNLGFAPSTTQACDTVPGVNRLRQGARVSVTANPNQNVKINFGCAFGGCIYNADGEANSVAPAGFSFPGLRKYSLVMRVGSQIVQGGTNMSFTTAGTGFLEVCVNDDALADNTGAWGLTFSVDETQSP